MAFAVNNRSAWGAYAEKLVRDYLCTQGAIIVATNFRVRGGEIDIVAQQGNELLFVEVKGRTKVSDHMYELVPLSKQRKIMCAALHIISKSNRLDIVYRFDVALVTPGDVEEIITYIPNAFYPLLD